MNFSYIRQHTNSQISRLQLKRALQINCPGRRPNHDLESSCPHNPLLRHNIPYAHVLLAKLDAHGFGLSRIQHGASEATQDLRRLAVGSGEAEVQLRDLVSRDGPGVLDLEADGEEMLVERGWATDVPDRGGGSQRCACSAGGLRG